MSTKICTFTEFHRHIDYVRFSHTLDVSGADTGFQKGGGTPKLNAENAKINDIMTFLINVRSNVYNRL